MLADRASRLCQSFRSPTRRWPFTLGVALLMVALAVAMPTAAQAHSAYRTPLPPKMDRAEVEPSSERRVEAGIETVALELPASEPPTSAPSADPPAASAAPPVPPGGSALGGQPPVAAPSPSSAASAPEPLEPVARSVASPPRPSEAPPSDVASESAARAPAPPETAVKQPVKVAPEAPSAGSAPITGVPRASEGAVADIAVVPTTEDGAVAAASPNESSEPPTDSSEHAAGDFVPAQEQLAVQTSETVQDAAAGTDDTHGPALVAVNESMTHQSIWQVQVGCVARCARTRQEQAAAQSAETEQHAAGEGLVANLAAVAQDIFQLQIGCALICVDTDQIQAAVQTATIEQEARVYAEPTVADAETAGAEKPPGFLTEEEFTELAAALRAFVADVLRSSTEQRIRQVQLGCLRSCERATQTQSATQLVSSRQATPVSEPASSRARPTAEPSPPGDAGEPEGFSAVLSWLRTLLTGRPRAADAPTDAPPDAPAPEEAGAVTRNSTTQALRQVQYGCLWDCSDQILRQVADQSARVEQHASGGRPPTGGVPASPPALTSA